MTFKFKLQIFISPFILFPIFIVIFINFILTGSKMKEMQYEILKNHLNYTISICDNEFEIIKKLKMDNDEYFKEAVIKKIFNEIDKIYIQDGKIFIIDSLTKKPVYFTGLSSELIDNSLINIVYIEKMINKKQGIIEFNEKIDKKSKRSNFAVFKSHDKWNWIIVVSIEKNYLFKYIYSSAILSFLIAVIFLIILFIISYFLSLGISKPLEILETSTDKISENNYDINIDIKSNDEFGNIAKKFNFMTQKIKLKNKELEEKNIELQTKNDELFQNYKKIELSEAALREGEKKYRTLIQKIQAAVIVHGVDTKVLISNSKAQELLGLTENQMLGKMAIDPVWNFFLENGTTMPLDKYPVNQVLASGQTLRNFNVGVHRPNNENDVWVLVNADPVFSKDNEIVQVIVTFFDISQRKQAEEKIIKSLRERETLIRELYHRTKNTMQVIRGMIVLQAEQYPKNAELQTVIKSTMDRIQAISLVHQMLYKSNDLSQISINEYIHELSSLIIQSSGVSTDRISLNIKIEEQYFLLDTAIPFGLILNELMTNSLKYAFPKNNKGIITVTLIKKDSVTSEFNYSDNGVGVPDGFDFRNQNTLGLKLIYNIGEDQMLGKVFMENNNGISFKLEFPNNLYKSRV